MLIFIAFLYFCLACSAIWLVVFPSGREFVAQIVSGRWSRIDQRLSSLHQVGVREVAELRHGTGRLLSRQLKFARRNALWLGAGLLAIIVPMVVVLTVGKPDALPGYESADLPPDPKVLALLAGENLAPPAALPPMAFSTREVELVRPMLVTASRNWGMLHPDFHQRLLMAFKIMREKHGYEMALLEGYRSPDRQNLLASIGAQVTNARAFQSWHQYGLAADCAFWRDGKLIISEKDPWAMRGYRLYGEVAESLGLTWGGRWTMMDFGHTELRVKGVMRK
ncbi:M15 family metallopeptidase [Massilia soli]|uniref:M15 family metallopeptidase n=1 Tax=Massilia soli TaxID=2792854 RepID=A0ABS7SNG1_9BURK|nr:M15 family metallopeptidase [Massilia soli]MBZ2207335.1 M15 family metallopeptidase [Massilia soli]